jgi:ABC-type bacteriocin/lantibiotic exporter with double-glycine peptidase domain
MKKLLNIFKNNWKSISLSYLLYFISVVLFSLYPKILGDTIDHLVNGEFGYIWALVIVFLGFVVFGYISNIYDTIAFSSVYRKVSSKEINTQIERGIDSSKINGRLSLMQSLITFFERNVTTIISTIVTLTVSLYFISYIDPWLMLWLFIAGICMLLVSYYFSPKIRKVTKKINDVVEEQTDIVTSLNIRSINNLLRRRQKLFIKQSNIYANFGGVIQIISYTLITCMLVYYVTNYNVTIGSVFSTYRYMFDFCNAVIGITYIIPEIINIKDVIRRLDE